METSVSTTTYRCTCTDAAADVCVGNNTFIAREPDGSCGCSCHIHYTEDPENWQPLHITPESLAAEFLAAKAEYITDDMGLWN